MLLLEFNQDAQTLLDWVIDCCYTAPRDIADSCFLALATVFNNRYIATITAQTTHRETYTHTDTESRVLCGDGDDRCPVGVL